MGRRRGEGGGRGLKGGVNGSGPTEEVVLGLARGVNAQLGSEWTIGESGTCGPSGGHQPNRAPYIPLPFSLYNRNLPPCTRAGCSLCTKDVCSLCTT